MGGVASRWGLGLVSGTGLAPRGAWVLALWSLLALPVLICHPLLNNCKPFHSSKNLQDISAFILSPELETI